MISQVHYSLFISQRDHANDSSIDDTPAFDSKHEVYFYCVLKLENIAVVNKHYPKKLALGKAHSAVIKCLKSLPTDASWNSVKALFISSFLWFQL